MHNGTPMLQKITATGCSLTALIAAFVSCAQDDPLVATAHAMSIFGYDSAAYLHSCTASPACYQVWD